MKRVVRLWVSPALGLFATSDAPGLRAIMFTLGASPIVFAHVGRWSERAPVSARPNMIHAGSTMIAPIIAQKNARSAQCRAAGDCMPVLVVMPRGYRASLGAAGVFAEG